MNVFRMLFFVGIILTELSSVNAQIIKFPGNSDKKSSPKLPPLFEAAHECDEVRFSELLKKNMPSINLTLEEASEHRFEPGNEKRNKNGKIIPDKAEKYINYTPLVFAAENGCTNIIQQLLDLKVDVKSQSGLPEYSPISIAASNGQVEAVRMLLKAKADQKEGLAAAIKNNQTEVIAYLNDVKTKLEAGQDMATAANLSGSNSINNAAVISKDMPPVVSLGANFHNFDYDNRQRLPLTDKADPRALGALVVSVYPGSSAELTGIKIDDVIVAYAGHQVVGAKDLVDMIRQSSRGSTIEVQVLRNGEKQSLTVQYGSSPMEVSLAWMNIGNQKWSDRKEEEALDAYKKSVSITQNNGTAWEALGEAYHNLKVAKDNVQAVNCFLKAAELGNVYAQYNLGLMYQNGQGVDKDLAEATKWYRKAADQGNVYAKSRISQIENATAAAKAHSDDAALIAATSQAIELPKALYGIPLGASLEEIQKWYEQKDVHVTGYTKTSVDEECKAILSKAKGHGLLQGIELGGEDIQYAKLEQQLTKTLSSPEGRDSYTLQFVGALQECCEATHNPTIFYKGTNYFLTSIDSLKPCKTYTLSLNPSEEMVNDDIKVIQILLKKKGEGLVSYGTAVVFGREESDKIADVLDKKYGTRHTGEDKRLEELRRITGISRLESPILQWRENIVMIGSSSGVLVARSIVQCVVVIYYDAEAAKQVIIEQDTLMREIQESKMLQEQKKLEKLKDNF